MSLLELAIVLALLTVIAAMVVPTIGPRLTRTREREAIARVESAVAIAQNRARASGRPLRLVVTREEPQRLLTVAVSMDAGIDAEPGTDRTEPAPRYLAELPTRCGIAQARPAGNADAPRPDEPAEDAGPLVLGWALPDGTFEPGTPATLKTDRATLALHFDAWTGAVDAEPLPAEAPTTGVTP